MNDFSAEPKRLREGMVSAAERVIESGWYVLGREVEKFEKQWSSFCGVEYGVGVANGMDAIEIALRSLGIGDGDEVITTAMTAFPTVLAIYRSGATPVLADIDPNTALLCSESVMRCISRKTKAVVLVHLYGQLKGMSDWVELCQLNNIHLVEDCAQSHLASESGKVAGSFGAIGAYSFYPTKNLGAVGDGGMLITDNENISSEAKTIRNYGQSVRYHHPVLGMNSRLDEIQAAILSVKLDWLEQFTARRKQIAAIYHSQIENSQISHLTVPSEKSLHVYHLFVITCLNRDKLQNYLLDNSVQSLFHYPVPIHKQESCANIVCDPIGLINSENHSVSCLSLPCHPQMSDDDVSKVVDIINRF